MLAVLQEGGQAPFKSFLHHIANISLEQQITWMSPESEWGALTNYMAKDADTERVDELDCTFDKLFVIFLTEEESVPPSPCIWARPVVIWFIEHHGSDPLSIWAQPFSGLAAPVCSFLECSFLCCPLSEHSCHEIRSPDHMERLQKVASTASHVHGWFSPTGLQMPAAPPASLDEKTCPAWPRIVRDSKMVTVYLRH